MCAFDVFRNFVSQRINVFHKHFTLKPFFLPFVYVNKLFQFKFVFRVDDLSYFLHCFLNKICFLLFFSPQNEWKILRWVNINNLTADETREKQVNNGWNYTNDSEHPRVTAIQFQFDLVTRGVDFVSVLTKKHIWERFTTSRQGKHPETKRLDTEKKEEKNKKWHFKRKEINLEIFKYSLA